MTRLIDYGKGKKKCAIMSTEVEFVKGKCYFKVTITETHFDFDNLALRNNSRQISDIVLCDRHTIRGAIEKELPMIEKYKMLEVWNSDPEVTIDNDGLMALEYHFKYFVPVGSRRKILFNAWIEGK